MPKLIVVASCVLEMAGKVLAGMRIDKDEKGEYCFPGGKHEYGETMVQTASRELKEETNLEVYPQWWSFVGYTEPTGKLILFYHTNRFLGNLKCLDPKFHSWDWIDRFRWPEKCVPGMELFKDVWRDWYGLTNRKASGG